MESIALNTCEEIKGSLTVLHGFPAPSMWKSTSDSMVGIDAIFVEDFEDEVRKSGRLNGLKRCEFIPAYKYQVFLDLPY